MPCDSARCAEMCCPLPLQRVGNPGGGRACTPEEKEGSCSLGCCHYAYQALKLARGSRSVRSKTPPPPSLLSCGSALVTASNWAPVRSSPPPIFPLCSQDYGLACMPPWEGEKEGGRMHSWLVRGRGDLGGRVAPYTHGAFRMEHCPIHPVSFCGPVWI